MRFLEAPPWQAALDVEQLGVSKLAEQASGIAEPELAGVGRVEGYEQGARVGEQVDAPGVPDAEVDVAGAVLSAQTLVAALCHSGSPHAPSWSRGQSSCD